MKQNVICPNCNEEMPFAGPVTDDEIAWICTHCSHYVLKSSMEQDGYLIQYEEFPDVESGFPDGRTYYAVIDRFDGSFLAEPWAFTPEEAIAEVKVLLEPAA